MTRQRCLAAALAAALLPAAPPAAAAREAPAGAVYTMTNAEDGNAVVAFARAADGGLAKLGVYPTGGKGIGTRLIPHMFNDGSGIDALTSNASLIASDDRRMLFAVNGESGTITSFRVEPDYTLAQVDSVPSGGRLPNSIAVRGDLLYVANANSPADGEPANVVGFRVAPDGKLAMISESPRRLDASPKTQPAHALFSPKGDFLLVTDNRADKIYVFRVGTGGVLSAKPAVDGSPGKTPFGVRFVGLNRFVVTEAQGGEKMGGHGKASASLYTIDADGKIEAVCASIANGQTASCWANVLPDMKVLYTSNTDSGTISCYALDPSAPKLTLAKAVVAQIPAPSGKETSGPTDSDLSRDGRFFYQLYAGVGRIAAYKVEADGSLAPIGGGEPAGMMPASGAVGLVAF